MPTPPAEQPANLNFYAQAAAADWHPNVEPFVFTSEMLAQAKAMLNKERSMSDSVCGYPDHLVAQIRVSSSQVKCLRCGRMFTCKAPGGRSKKSWLYGAEFYKGKPLAPPPAPPEVDDDGNDFVYEDPPYDPNDE